MDCPKCQFDNPDSVTFCGNCGNRIEKVCSNCGAANPPQFKFCGKCGYDLRKAREKTPIDFSQPQSYTPKHLANKILTHRSAIEGERKLVTVMFADVANFTKMSEKLDPEEVHQIMDGCFKVLMDQIHRREGTINQFTGDGVMAIFGAPVAHEDHASRACLAALDIQKSLQAYGEKIKRDTGADFTMRIGMNSGPVIVGAIGDDLRMDYTAVGDTTNLAARMQSCALPGTILVSENTHRLARDFFEFEAKGTTEVKGKQEPQVVFVLTKAGEVNTRIGASVAKGLTRFVGRKNSMATLMGTLEKARTGTGQVMAIIGEAGVGKSRLLYEVRLRLPGDETLYLEGRCLHFGASMPYLPLLDIIKTYFGIQEGDREFVIQKKLKDRLAILDEYSPCVSVFQDLLSLSIEDQAYLALDPKSKREKTFESLRDLLIRISHQKLLVLAIEDLQWIDKTSEAFVDYLIDWLAHSHVLLILLYRPEYTHRWASKTYYTQIGLDQLGQASSRELIGAILEEGEPSPELSELIMHRAAGNPLFVEEFTHTLLESGNIERRKNQYSLKKNPSEIRIPDSIQGIIAARMDRLEENIKRTMQVASVIGRDFSYRILQTITGLSQELKSYLLNLQGLEIIYEKRLFPELEYIFKHALIQEVAYNSLLSNRRKEIHKKIGEAIEILYAEKLEELYEILAYHYCKTDEVSKAYNYLKLSGQKAAGNYAVWEAYGFYKEAMELFDRLPGVEASKKELLQLTNLLRYPMVLLGFPEGSLSILQHIEMMASDMLGNERLEPLHTLFAAFYAHTGDQVMAIRYTQARFDEARNVQDIDVVAHLSFSLMTAFQNTGQNSKMIEIAPAVIDLIEETEREFDFFNLNLAPYPCLCAYYGVALAHAGRFDEGQIFSEKGLIIANQLKNLMTRGFVHFLYGILFFGKGDWDSAKEHFDQGMSYCEESKWHWGKAICLCLSGHAYALLDDPGNGIKQAQKGLQMLLDSGLELCLPLSYWSVGLIWLDLGEMGKADNAMKEAMRVACKNKDKQLEGLSWFGLGKLSAKRDPRQIAETEECFFKGLQILDDLGFKGYSHVGRLWLGECYLNAGAHTKAMDFLKSAELAFEEMGMDYWLDKTRKTLAQL